MMPKLLRSIAFISLFSIAILTFVPSVAIAGDDTALAKELYDQAKAKGRESSDAIDKMQEAFDRGDTAAACDHVRQSQRAMQLSYDFGLRMTKLDLDPQNAEVARGLVSVSRASLESGDTLLNTPECRASLGPVADPENDKDMNGLNVGVRQAREADVEGNAAFAGGQWVIACDSLAAAEQWYAFNSRFALEVSASFAAKNNPQPQLAGLSAELKGLEKIATPKRIKACRNKMYGVDVSAASIPAKDKAEMTAYDALLDQHNPLADQFYAANGKGNFDVACPILTKLIAVQKSLIAKSALLLTRYNAEDLKKQNEKISGFLVMSQKLQAEHCV